MRRANQTKRKRKMQIILNKIDEYLQEIDTRRDKFRKTALLYTELHDSHGVADMGMELQALDRVYNTLKGLREWIMQQL